MKMAMLIVVMLTMSLSAKADWILMSKGSIGNEYIEESRIERAGHIRTVPHLLNLNSTNLRGVSSAVYIKEVNCQTKQTRTTWGRTYSGPMGGGELIKENSAPSEWESAKTGSVGELTVAFICAKPM